MPYDLEISEHESAVAKLRNQQDSERKAQLTEQLRDTRQRLRIAKLEYEKLAVSIRRQQDQRAEKQAEVLRLIDALAEHASHRPDVADFLPDDDEVQRWSKEHARLTRLRDKLSASIPPEPNRVRAVQLGNDITVLENVERNTLERLRGTIGKFDSGGLSAVNPYRS